MTSSYDPKFYVDNEYETIYYSDQLPFDGIGAGNNSQLRASLNEIDSAKVNIQGQSTWFVHSIQFGFEAYKDPDGSAATFTYGKSLLGIVPYGEPGIWDDLDDYQDSPFWPLKGTIKPWSIGKGDSALGYQAQVQTYKTSRSGTWKPRRGVLTLNRMQEIMFNFHVDTGVDLYGHMFLNITARRGE